MIGEVKRQQFYTFYAKLHFRSKKMSSAFDSIKRQRSAASKAFAELKSDSDIRLRNVLLFEFFVVVFCFS